MKLKRLTAALMALTLMISSLAAVYAEGADENAETGEPQDAVTAPQQSVSNFTMPNNQRATIITPGVDYPAGESATAEAAASELDALYGELTEIGLNTVYINTVYNGQPYFSTDMNNTDEIDFLSMALEKAHEYNLRVFMVLDMNYMLSMTEEGADRLDSLISNTHRFMLKYKSEGILIDDYYGEKSSAGYSDYMQNGSGIGYDNWLYDSNEMYISALSEVVRITDNSVPVGILINDMWANSSDNEEGSETTDPVQALYDGFSDTRKFIAEGYADFCVVNAYGSLTSSSVPFEKVAGWWNNLSEQYGITMYIAHFNEYQGSVKEGWAADDQILRQLALAKELTAFGGSIFHSCEGLLTNTALTKNITKFYGDDININALFEELRMQSPSQLSFVTYEPYADFMGTFDENFEVLFNGKIVTLNSAGNFYFEEPLDIGMNTFTIEHKGKVFRYRIERKIDTIKSLDPSIASGKSLSVTGETKLEISCTAYKGATVTASLNGKTVTLKESEGQQDSDINSSYTRFVGTYTVPEGIISKEQNLGTIQVTSSYAGYTQTLFGASVKVLALPEPPKEINTSLGDQNSAGSGEVVGTMDPVHTDSENVQYIKVIKNYTTVYNGATAGSIPTPDYAQLPAGTLDYLLAYSGDYCITESGKRFKKIDVTVFDDTGLDKNALLVKSSGTSGGSSYFKIELDHKISYNIDFVGLNYFGGGDGEFNLTDFTATHVYITFDNITSVTKLPDFTNNYVFSAGKWETVTVDGVPKFRMVLTLRQPKVYAGCGAYYNTDGDLMLTFGITTNTLSGMTIVIDPGHGYCDDEDSNGIGLGNFHFDPGAVGFIREYDANLGIAKELESQLKALGANVIRIKTETDKVNTRQRPNYGREFGCDMYISIHANKIAGNPTVRGTEVYYFTPYSQPLAAAISSQIAGYFSSSVYSDGANKNRGAKYSYFKMTLQQDFPSIMIETGFVSNEEEALALADPEHQKNIAAAIINGIKSYIGRSSLSYSSDGISGTETQPIQTTAAETPPPEVRTAPPEEVTVPSETVTEPPETTTVPPETETAPIGEEAEPIERYEAEYPSQETE